MLFGTGTGCNGAIHIFIEPICPPNVTTGEPEVILGFIQSTLASRNKGFVATIVSSTGCPELDVGDRIMLIEEASQLKSMRGHWSSDLIEKLHPQFSGKGPRLLSVEVGAGQIQVFCEIIIPSPLLVIFGAGQDAVPLVHLAKEIGFRVEVFDWRAAYFANNRFAKADAIHVGRPETIFRHVTFDKDTNVVIMSHNFLADLECFKQLIASPIQYLGLMGPKKRAQRMLDELAREGIIPVSDELEKLHNPVGLDIGAEYPEEIALAIIAEIQSVLRSRPAHSLRAKNGPIHGARKEQELHKTQPVERICTALVS